MGGTHNPVFTTVGGVDRDGGRRLIGNGENGVAHIEAGVRRRIMRRHLDQSLRRRDARDGPGIDAVVGLARGYGRIAPAVVGRVGDVDGGHGHVVRGRPGDVVRASESPVFAAVGAVDGHHRKRGVGPQHSQLAITVLVVPNRPGLAIHQSIGRELGLDLCRGEARRVGQDQRDTPGDMRRGHARPRHDEVLAVGMNVRCIRRRVHHRGES